MSSRTPRNPLTRQMARLLARAALVLAPIFAATAAHAAATVDCSSPLDVHLSYQVGHALGREITDVITFNDYAVCSGTGAWWPSTVGAEGGTVVDPFAKSSSNQPTRGLMLGLTQDLPGDPEGQMHVVMMVDSAAAAAASGIAWGTTFPTTLEERIISNLVLTMRTDRALLEEGSAEAIAWDAALTELFDFVNGEASGMFFAMPDIVLGETTASAFTVVAWTDGRIVGEGTAFAATDASVPEPMSLMLVLPALAGLGLRRRRAS